MLYKHWHAWSRSHHQDRVLQGNYLYIPKLKKVFKILMLQYSLQMNLGLMIGETWFPHKECQKVTWVSPDPQGRTQNEIDHICIRRNWRKSLLDILNKRGQMLVPITI
jgi:hypothetical protein